ncbi:MAG TPA: SDR family oxidoreductase [Hanamia sp.]|jgi:short-subunit dehydrogenase|nr:SDR family oxidoreductase [Hanamia sp.]
MFENKIVVITGGTDGIGKALVADFLNRGAKVSTCARTAEKLEELKNEFLGKPLFTMVADVSKEDDCKNFIQKTIEKFNAIDVLINNAGISMRGMFQETSLETLRRVMDINFWGTVYCTKFALDSILENKGTLVGMSSVAGYRGLPGRSGYSASKFAINGWLEAIRTELLETGVNVMWVCPGFTKSNIRNAALNKDAKPQGESPLKEEKLMTAEECAQHIIKAIEKRKRTLVLTFTGKETVYMNKFFPSLTDKLTRKFFFKNGELIK